MYYLLNKYHKCPLHTNLNVQVRNFYYTAQYFTIDKKIYSLPIGKPGDNVLFNEKHKQEKKK